MQKNAVNQRVRAKWRARACAAAVTAGAQIFCFGAGIAVPLALNAAWLCALPAAGLCALLAARARSLLVSMQGRRMSAWRALLFAAVMLASCLYLIASMVSLSVQTLLVQSRALDCALLTLLFLLLAALSRMEGVSRLCFALRFVLPAALLVCALAIMPRGAVSGLFPLLGSGAGRLSLGAAAMLGAAAPALMLMLPGDGQDDPSRGASIPSAGFFSLRIGLGALLGAASLLLPALYGGYAAMRGQNIWGARLHIAAVNGAKPILWQTALLLAQLGAMSFGACTLLCAAEEAVASAFPRLAKGRAGLLICTALLAFSLWLLTVFGYEAALAAAPLIALPIPALLLPAAKKKRIGPSTEQKGKTP